MFGPAGTAPEAQGPVPPPKVRSPLRVTDDALAKSASPAAVQRRRRLAASTRPGDDRVISISRRGRARPRGSRRVAYQTIVTAAMLTPEEPPSISTLAPGTRAPAACASHICSGRLTVLVLPKRSTVLQILGPGFPSGPRSSI